MKKTGRCLCGAVRYEAEFEEPAAHACHCGMCRRWSGSVGMALPATTIAFEDEEPITLYNSSEWAERGFCGTCGGHLFYRLKQNGQTIVWFGTLDDVSDITMGSEMYVDHKPDFLAFTGDHPRLTEKEFLEQMGMG